MAKDLLAVMIETGQFAAAVVAEKPRRQVSDTGAIEAVIDQAMAEQADKVAEYR